MESTSKVSNSSSIEGKTPSEQQSSKLLRKASKTTNLKNSIKQKLNDIKLTEEKLLQEENSLSQKPKRKKLKAEVGAMLNSLGRDGMDLKTTPATKEFKTIKLAMNNSAPKITLGESYSLILQLWGEETYKKIIAEIEILREAKKKECTTAVVKQSTNFTLDLS